VFAAAEFVVNIEAKTCICPAGNEMICLGDNFENERGKYIRFRGYLKDCRDCPLQTNCMQNPTKKQGRQVSFLLEDQEKTSYLDLMKKIIDSDAGRRDYGRRMWTMGK
jgi:hypothetical protein